MPAAIRLAAPSERAALEDLQRRAALANPGDRAALLAHPEAIALPLSQIEDGLVFVAGPPEQPLGFSAVLPRPDGNFDLDGLFVDPNLWRGGLGRALVERAALHALEHGASVLHVVGNPHAEGFYLRCGFRQTDISQTQFGTGLLMELAL